jgi:predicted CXXCH cytochrome family protein
MKFTLLFLLALATAWTADTCLECHSALGDELGAPAASYQDDVHQGLGFGCAACHGGDPAQESPELSMSRARGFKGKIPRTAVPELCAHCHSDATLIHKFDPNERVDQLDQYRTSVHGKRLAAGDTAVANCVDCHGVHNVRAPRDPLSPVHPLRLPDTCGRCHSDATLMAKYNLDTSAYADYQESVHWAALSERGDLSAPGCASCHGNHGATPPEVSSVAAVCGTCHVLLENLYRDSPHKPVFDEMGMGGCVVCHGNHLVEHPTTELLAGEAAVCRQCHEADSPGGEAAVEMGRLITSLGDELDRSEELLERARQSGMEVSEALLLLAEGRASLVKARVAVHAFRVEEVREPVEAGEAIAVETLGAGEDALQEWENRRIGLGLALLTILATMAGLWLAIRRIEGTGEGEVNSS